MLNKKKVFLKKKRKKKWKFDINSKRKWVQSSSSCESEITSVNSRYYHTQKYIILYSASTTTSQKGLYLFYMKSEGYRRILTMSLAGHDYYGTINTMN